jgi:hypothetical protein
MSMRNRSGGEHRLKQIAPIAGSFVLNAKHSDAPALTLRV